MPHLKTLGKRKLLLDTHVWIWLVEGEKKLKSSFIKSVEEHKYEGGLFISPISIWEIGMLVEKERLLLAIDRLDWVERALSVPGFELAPITPRIAIQSSRLPGTVHGDPADRMLIATAREMNATLVTCDKVLLTFGKDRFINVYDPSKSVS